MWVCTVSKGNPDTPYIQAFDAMPKQGFTGIIVLKHFEAIKHFPKYDLDILTYHSGKSTGENNKIIYGRIGFSCNTFRVLISSIPAHRQTHTHTHFMVDWGALVCWCYPLCLCVWVTCWFHSVNPFDTWANSTTMPLWQFHAEGEKNENLS